MRAGQHQLSGPFPLARRAHQQRRSHVIASAACRQATVGQPIQSAARDPLDRRGAAPLAMTKGTTVAARSINSTAKGCRGASAMRYFAAMHTARPVLPTIAALTAVACARAAGEDGDEDRPGEGGGRVGTGDEVGVATKTKAKSKKPSQFKVLLLNDDYTPMEFVVMVLKRFFHMDLEQATRVMLHVHQRGVGVCGIYPYEIAETKVTQVMDFAKQNQHPLQCTLEKA
jgi:ATP-dependent Clp protease adaptor protein ClpS